MIKEDDRRRGQRFRMRLNCRVSFPRNALETLSGITRDVSRSGLLILLEDSEPSTAPAVGDMARVMVELPQSAESSPRCLDCVARVLRIDETENGTRTIAFEVRRMRFCGLTEMGDSKEEDSPPPATSGLLQ